jgi:hypothetical protein
MTTQKTEFTFSEILELLWAEPSTLDPKTALKAEAFRKVFLACFKKDLKPKGLPPGINQQQVENVRARTWDNFRKKLNPPHQPIENSLPDKIIVLMLMPLQMAVGHGKDDDDEQTESLLSLSTKEGKTYLEENDSSIMVYRDDESWKISFRTMLPALAEQSVLIVINDEEGKEIKTLTKELEENEEDEVWEFEEPLPQEMNLSNSYRIEIKPLR